MSILSAPPAVSVALGVDYFPGLLDRAAQEALRDEVRAVLIEAPDETVPAGTVSQVVQSGWTIGDRVLRPAMVGVSKGGPKAAPREEPAPGGK